MGEVVSGTKKVTRKMKVVNEQGLHARPAAMLVKLTNQFKSRITIENDGEEVDAKSIMGIMMLAISYGSEIIIQAEGEDAEKSITAIEKLINSGFTEGA